LTGDDGMGEIFTHTFEPIFDKNSEILVLGSFPSVKSRENNFYYAHPQNRFWRVVASVYSCPVPKTVEEKKNMLLSNKIAVWDVIKSCEITGSADSTIKSVIPNDLSEILSVADIKKIYANGKTAQSLYNKYIKKNTGFDIISLPSTSPANAAYSLEKLIKEWKIINEYNRNCL
jgi:double-stranded uracil-DNA glycosylase